MAEHIPRPTAFCNTAALLLSACKGALLVLYASSIKRFTGYTEDRGTFMDVKEWPATKNLKKYDGEKVVIGTVSYSYNPLGGTLRKELCGACRSPPS